VTADDLKIGQSAKVDAFADEAIGRQLLEMGVVPGDTIKIERIAPMGDPIAIRVSDLLLCIRRKEASSIMVQTSF